MSTGGARAESRRVCCISCYIEMRRVGPGRAALLGSPPCSPRAPLRLSLDSGLRILSRSRLLHERHHLRVERDAQLLPRALIQ